MELARRGRRRRRDPRGLGEHLPDLRRRPPGTWTTGPRSLVTRHGLQTFYVDGVLFTVGGCTTKLADSQIVERRVLPVALTSGAEVRLSSKWPCGAERVRPLDWKLEEGRSAKKDMAPARCLASSQSSRSEPPVAVATTTMTAAGGDTGGDRHRRQPAAEQVMTIGWGAEPPSLDPGIAEDTTSSNSSWPSWTRSSS